MLTLNQHIKLFSDFATSHQVINSFDFGDPWEWYNSLHTGTDHLIYPAMFVAPVGSSVGDNLLTRKYRVFFCERERKAEENENDGLSDCERLWFDFISYMAKSLNDQPVAINKSLSAEPATESGVDYVVGYIGDFSLEESYDYNDCIIPFVNPNALSWYNTTNVTVSNDGQSIESNGGTDSVWTARNPYSQTIGSSNVFDVTFTLDEANNVMFGVAKSSKTAMTYTDIDYAFSRQNDTNLYIYENGANPSTIAGVTHGQTCRILSDGSSVKYYYNGVLKYTSLTAPTVGDWKLKASLYVAAGNNVNNIDT